MFGQIGLVLLFISDLAVNAFGEIVSIFIVSVHAVVAALFVKLEVLKPDDLNTRIVFSSVSGCF